MPTRLRDPLLKRQAEAFHERETRRVRLVAFGGRAVLVEFNGLTEGATHPQRLAEGLKRARGAPDMPTAGRLAMAHEIGRDEYAAPYGPTAGGGIRLGNTNLIRLSERDQTSYRDEVLRACGKTMRTGLMMNP